MSNKKKKKRREKHWKGNPTVNNNLPTKKT